MKLIFSSPNIISVENKDTILWCFTYSYVKLYFKKNVFHVFRVSFFDLLHCKKICVLDQCFPNFIRGSGIFILNRRDTNIFQYVPK